MKGESEDSYNKEERQEIIRQLKAQLLLDQEAAEERAAAAIAWLEGMHQPKKITKKKGAPPPSPAGAPPTPRRSPAHLGPLRAGRRPDSPRTN
eukprot:233170-Pyramimonas_sp.AAC.1